MGFRFQTTGDKDMQRALRGMARAGVDMGPPLTAFGNHMQSIVPRSIEEQKDPETGAPWPRPSDLTLSLRPGGGGGGKRNFDNGRLARSFMGTTRVTRTGVSIHSNLPYALTQQEGGTIRPRNAKYLAVPLDRQAKRAGSARRWWEKAEAQGREPFVLRRGSGSLTIMARSRQGSKKLVAYFRLVKQITIQPAPFAGFKNEDRELFAGLLTAHVARAGGLL